MRVIKYALKRTDVDPRDKQRDVKNVPLAINNRFPLVGRDRIRCQIL